MAVIDVHAHWEPRMLDVPAMLAKMDAKRIDKVALIPAMNDPLPDETPEALLKVLRFAMRSCHPLAQALNVAFMTDEGNLRLKGRVFEIYARPDNAAVARVLAEHPDRFLGWIFLNPRAAIGIDELERWRHRPGFVGVKLHPHWHGWKVEEAIPIATRCEELGLPILIHLGFARKGEWRVLADACPRLTMIFAHAGMPHFDRMWGAIRDYPHLYLDVSSPYLDEALARDAVRAVGAERTLYGTDAPYGFHDDEGHTYDYGAIRGWVERLPLAAREIDAVLGGNVERLIGEGGGKR
ncbi:MAG: amidohydrolase [Kofleriaceae bacterium]|nr:MAG: amidohydrolase [Kofleriaceae bacterium]MBZ0233580.1 amidohydrolase [Kofleriaceae bacterium]